MRFFNLWRQICSIFILLYIGLSAPVAAQEPIRVGSNFLASGLDPSSLDPTKGSNGWALVSYGVGENLYTIDKEGKLQPELASAATRNDDLNWTITLKPDRFFADGTPVTAAALASGFANTMEKTPVASSTGGMLSFEALDALNLRVTTQKPVPLIQALFAEWPMIAYKLTDEGEAIYTGPYKVVDFKADSHLELAANEYFDGAQNRSPVIIRRFADAQAMALAYQAGELDLAFRLPFEIAPRLSADPDLIIKSFPVAYQYMAFINTTLAPFDDVRLRQAIDSAINRAELIAMLGGGDVATGAFAPYFSFSAREPRPTDLARAEALLDAAGWLKGADGVRTKDGQKLQLLIATYNASDLIAMLPLLRAQLARVGIEAQTQVFENVPQISATEGINIVVLAQNTAPTGDPAFVMDSMFRTGAALNHAHYASAEFDAIIDKFATSGDVEERAQIARQAQEKLFEDVPVSFLVSPVWYVGLSPRLKNYQPWGSDYHILRADIGEK